MISFSDLQIMNETLINYYKECIPENEKKILKHRIIKEILKDVNCFKKMNKQEAIKILKDIGIDKEETEKIYNELMKKN